MTTNDIIRKLFVRAHFEAPIVYSVGRQCVNRGRGERAYTSVSLPVFVPPKRYNVRQSWVEL